MLGRGTDRAAAFINITLRCPDGTKKSRHWRQASGVREVGCGVDITGRLPGRWHVVWRIPGGGAALVNEGCVLHCSCAWEAVGVVHVFFWNSTIFVHLKWTIHVGKLAVTSCVPVNEAVSIQIIEVFQEDFQE